jgi:hypothetical protein
MTKEYFIPLNTPSLKNSKIKTSRGIFPSKTVMKYLRELGVQKYSSSKKEIVDYKTKPNLFREAFKGWKKPDNLIVLGMHFVRNSKRGFDFNNASQVILDLMTAHNFIEDDDCYHVVPQYYEKNGKYHTIDKENPGVYVKIIEDGN